MKITKETVRKTAHLARLNVPPEKENEMVNDLQKMVDWMDKLREVDTEKVEPLASMSFEVNAFREDKAGQHLSKEKALKNAPRHNKDFFVVPKVIK